MRQERRSNITAEAKLSLPHAACVVLAGGHSRRFGSDKARAKLRGERLIDLVIGRLEAQTSAPIVINTTEADLCCDHVSIADHLEGDVGPLAGLHAALCWAEDSGFGTVITAPVDTPNLPENYIKSLVASALPSIAYCRGQVHALHGIWPVNLRGQLEAQIQVGTRAARDWAKICNANHCEFAGDDAVDPFFNINTREDLTRFAQALPRNIPI